MIKEQPETNGRLEVSERDEMFYGSRLMAAQEGSRESETAEEPMASEPSLGNRAEAAFGYKRRCKPRATLTAG